MRGRKIAVLRANGLGDFIFVLPALHALKQTFPNDEIVFLGKKLHHDLLMNRPGPVDRVVIVPPYPGVGEAEDYQPDSEQVNNFFNRMVEEHFDVAIQMHGGGGNSNPFLLRLGAKVNIGLKACGAPPVDISIPYVRYFSETLRYLEVVSRLGAKTTDITPRLQVTPFDVMEARQAYPDLDNIRAVVIHPSATDPRRRWPTRNFAMIADFLIEQGLTVFINGVRSETSIGEDIIMQMQHRESIHNLCGNLPVTALAGLISVAELVISNDSGPLHLAYALNAPSIGIYWMGNMITAAPMTVSLNRPLISWTTHCPLCGEEITSPRPPGNLCEHNTSFVTSVSVEEVQKAAEELLQHQDNPVRIAV